MQNQLKQQAAAAALAYIKPDMVVGVGTGSTTNFFIEALAGIKHRIEGAVASSQATATRLKTLGIRMIDPNSVDKIDVYVDGADEINPLGQMIKGGGGAHTGEKILASMATQFICIADQSKTVETLGQFPVAVEVLPLARSFVARAIVKLDADPSYRQGFLTDHGNMILDVSGLDLTDALAMEMAINLIPGVIENGIFAKRKADLILLAKPEGIKILTF